MDRLEHWIEDPNKSVEPDSTKVDKFLSVIESANKTGTV